MASVTIRLEFNLDTGKKDVFIDYTSEEDAMPIEHEQDHREIVEQILGKGILQPDELGAVVVRGKGARTVQSQEQQVGEQALSEES